MCCARLPRRNRIEAMTFPSSSPAFCPSSFNSGSFSVPFLRVQDYCAHQLDFPEGCCPLGRICVSAHGLTSFFSRPMILIEAGSFDMPFRPSSALSLPFDFGEGSLLPFLLPPHRGSGGRGILTRDAVSTRPQWSRTRFFRS